MKGIIEEDLKDINNQSESILHMKPVKIDRMGGMNNHTYKVEFLGGLEYVFRIPGDGTNELINRREEKVHTLLANNLGIDAKVLYFDDEGYKITEYLKDAITMSPTTMRNSDIIKKAASIFATLHNSGVDTNIKFDVFKMANEYEEFLRENNVELYDDYDEIKGEVLDIAKLYSNVKLVPCHNDPLSENWVLSNDKLYLIDYEYGGMNDPLWDVADLSIEANYNDEMDDMLLKTYYGRDFTLEEYKEFLANKLFIDYLWTLWGLSRVPYDGDKLQKYADERYDRCKSNLKRFLKRDAI